MRGEKERKKERKKKKNAFNRGEYVLHATPKDQPLPF
jgi:hypothetical protein